MFEISPKAFAAFEGKAESEFIERLGHVLRTAVPSLQSEPQPAFFAQLRLLVEQARSFGLCSERAVGGFAITAALLGVDFVDRFPGARQILLGSETGDRKAELLEAFTLNLFEILER